MPAQGHRCCYLRTFVMLFDVRPLRCAVLALLCTGAGWTGVPLQLLPHVSHVDLTACTKDFPGVSVPFSHQTHTQAALNRAFDYPASAKIFLLNLYWIKY